MGDGTQVQGIAMSVFDRRVDPQWFLAAKSIFNDPPSFPFLGSLLKVKVNPPLMNKLILTATLSLFLLGCNMNPSKEARLQKLEAEIEQSMDNVNELENRIQTLEKANALLKKKVTELEEN